MMNEKYRSSHEKVFWKNVIATATTFVYLPEFQTEIKEH